MSKPHLLAVPVLKQAWFGEIAKLRHLKGDHDL